MGVAPSIYAQYNSVGRRRATEHEEFTWRLPPIFTKSTRSVPGPSIHIADHRYAGTCGALSNCTTSSSKSASGTWKAARTITKAYSSYSKWSRIRHGWMLCLSHRVPAGRLDECSLGRFWSKIRNACKYYLTHNISLKLTLVLFIFPCFIYTTPFNEELIILQL